MIYRILKEDNTKALEKEVQKYLDLHWDLQGGPFLITAPFYGVYLCQAVVGHDES